MTDVTTEASEAGGNTLLTEPDAAPPEAGQQTATTEGEKQEQQQTATTEGAPDAYEFAAPDGHVLDETVIGKFSEVAKELNLTNANAQKVLDVMAPAIAERQAAALQSMTEEWSNSARADKEFGGEKLAENLAVAKTALDKFATPEFRALLNDTGLGNHPEVLRVFYRAGKAISADTVVTGKQAPAPVDRLSILYDNTPKS